jgi:hypothetical protein
VTEGHPKAPRNAVVRSMASGPRVRNGAGGLDVQAEMTPIGEGEVA